MTDRRDLKQRIRQRQEKTGERYTTARAHVLRTREPPDWVVELSDVTARARAAGLHGTVAVESSLRLPNAELDAILGRLRALLVSPLDGLGVLRRALLAGEPPAPADATEGYLRVVEIERFLAGLELGLRGPALHGRLLAFDVPLPCGVVTVVSEVLYGPHAGERRVVLSRYSSGKPHLVFFSGVVAAAAAR